MSLDFNVNIGVPEGRVLGPLLFILYVNDIKKALQQSKFHLFGDDIVTHITGNNVIKTIVKIILKNIKMSLQINKLKITMNKTKTMVLGNIKIKSIDMIGGQR